MTHQIQTEPTAMSVRMVNTWGVASQLVVRQGDRIQIECVKRTHPCYGWEMRAQVVEMIESHAIPTPEQLEAIQPLGGHVLRHARARNANQRLLLKKANGTLILVKFDKRAMLVRLVPGEIG